MTGGYRQAGPPYCGNCGYDLTGAVQASACPECGKPLVEVLMRPEHELKGGRRWRSRARVMGMPAIDIAFGPAGNDPVGKARGFVAIGNQARGVLAIGGQSVGVVSIGGLSTGVLSLGGTSIGVVSFGGMGLGLLAGVGGMGMGGLAKGGLAVGGVAQGGMAVGYATRGGAAIGPHAIRPGGADATAQSIFDALSFFFGSAAFDLWHFVTTAALLVLLILVIGGAIFLRAWTAVQADPGVDGD